MRQRPQSPPEAARNTAGIGPKDADRVLLNVQPVVPFSLNEDWNLISRTILPIDYLGSTADGVDSAFGLGDTVRSFFFSPNKPTKGGWITGFGPVHGELLFKRLQVTDIARGNEISTGTG